MQCVNCEIKHNKGLGGSDIAGIRIAAANTDMIGSDGSLESRLSWAQAAEAAGAPGKIEK